MNSNVEVWKDVVGFEEYFQVSNLGRVYSKRTGKILAQTKLKSGYMVINTRIGGREGVCHSIRVHRMVAEAFLGEPSQHLLDVASKTVYGKVPVNHKDGDKTNNNQDNLEWVTYSENSKHAYETGLASAVRGESNPFAKLRDEDVSLIRAMYQPGVRGKGRRSISKSLGLPLAAVTRVIHRNTWSHVVDKSQ